MSLTTVMSTTNIRVYGIYNSIDMKKIMQPAAATTKPNTAKISAIPVRLAFEMSLQKKLACNCRLRFALYNGNDCAL